jgi:hypothetical protein
MTMFLRLLNKNVASKVVGIKSSIPTIIKPQMRAEIDTEQCIINIRTNKWICNNNSLYLKENEYIKNKKLISISPGGFKGFYMLGTCAFIKETYVLDDYIYSGASAGAWNSLFMTYKKDPIELAYELLDDKLNNAVSIIDLEYMIKYKILNKFKADDFDLKKLFVGVTSFDYMKINTHIFSDFETLDDAVNSCIASSHIPYITGNSFSNKYQTLNAFDGGFSKYPYLNVMKPSLHITPSIWKDTTTIDLCNDQEINSKNCIKNLLNMSTQISDYTTLFSREKYNFVELYENGYNDAKKNKEFLDNALIY